MRYSGRSISYSNYENNQQAGTQDLKISLTYENMIGNRKRFYSINIFYININILIYFIFILQLYIYIYIITIIIYFIFILQLIY